MSALSALSVQTPILDHIVILVSHSTLLTLSTDLEDSFTVIIGGSHADGLTSNNLIIFQDGSYIEVIAFFDDADPEKRASHRWGRLPENTIIDWAYTLPHESDFAAVQQRVAEAQSAYAYGDPVPGGRERPDGEVLRWAVAGASDNTTGKRVSPGKLPFWCLDRTPRELRVPYQGNPQTKHPSGALGVAKVTVRVPEAQLEDVSKAYSAIHGSAPSGDRSWHFAVHSGAHAGGNHHQVSITSAEEGADVTLVLLGTHQSSKNVHIVPGLSIRIES